MPADSSFVVAVAFLFIGVLALLFAPSYAHSNPGRVGLRLLGVLLLLVGLAFLTVGA